jgi:hypothetical protein
MCSGGYLSSWACRLCDKSVAVRKKALQLLSTLLAQDLPGPWLQAVSSTVLPIATQLLNAAPDSELSYGEEGSQVCVHRLHYPLNQTLESWTPL